MKEKAHLRLAAELEKIGAYYMASRARDGYYGEAPAAQLAEDLVRLGTPAALDLRRRHVRDGEFDDE